MIRLFELSRGREFWGSPGAIRRLHLDCHCDFFATISLFGLILVDAPSWRSIAVAGVIGIAIDVACHLLSPECRMPVFQIADLVEAVIADTADFKCKVRHYKRIVSVISEAWLAYPWLVISPAPSWSGYIGHLGLPCRSERVNSIITYRHSHREPWPNSQAMDTNGVLNSYH